MRFDTAVVVDDESGSRAVLRHALELMGLEVAEARNGNEGLGVIQSRRPDLVLTDVRMPGLDGIRMASRIRGEPALVLVEIVAVTRHPQDVEDDHPFDLVLRKPVSIRILRDWMMGSETEPG